MADRSCPGCRAYAVCERTIRPNDPRILGLREFDPICADKLITLSHTLAKVCDQYHETPEHQLPPTASSSPASGRGER